MLLRTYIPDTIVDNWRIVGTTTILVGLCLCPLVASVWECPSDKDAQTEENDMDED